MPKALRRRPVPRDLYRGVARTVGKGAKKPKLKRRRRRGLVDLTVSVLLLAVGLGFAIAAGNTLAQTLGGIGDAASNALPKTIEGNAQLTLPEIRGEVTPAPIADGLPPFVNKAPFIFYGHVPSFAIGNGRVVDVSLNGTKVQTSGLDAQGKFGAVMTLRAGANTITTTLMDKATKVADASFTVVLKTNPPALSLVRPKDKDELAGPNVVVEGKAEAGATVSINGHTVSANPDGTFSDVIPATAGPLAISVIARDEAGNETAQKVAVTVKPAATPVAVGAAITVLLDRTAVKPGELIGAEVYLTNNGATLPDTAVTLQVGVFVVGTQTTDKIGHTRFAFAAPTTEGEVRVVVLGGGASGGATFTVAIPKPSILPSIPPSVP